MTGSDKILIHFPVDRIAPKGGPAGYLYNLRLGLEEIGAEGFDFLPPVGATYEQNKTLQKLVPNRIKDLRRLHNLLVLLTKDAPTAVDYSRYKALHFHSTEDLYLHRKALESYRGKVVLTSHSPCAYHKELISRLNPKDAQRKAEALASLELIDEYAFNRADYVIFPCGEAEEPYFNTWDKYAEIRSTATLRYVPTGIVPANAKTNRCEVRQRYGIPADAFVACYAGRHNQIKGYDILEAAAKGLLADEKIWFLVAGREGPLYGLDHSRWIEAGWTDDPHSLMAASDVFILPNRETFFDLIMLEVLSLGQVVIASRTGGNKYFERFGSDGILLYDKPSDMKNMVRRVKAATSAQREYMGAANRGIYRSEFTVGVFARRYKEIMKEIASE